MDKDKIIRELQFRAVKSSGAGGQNVNKVSSKVVLQFDVCHSKALSKEEKSLVKNKLASRMNSNHILTLQCDEDRSQMRNKEIVIDRFLDMISKSLVVPKTRKATKVPKSVIEKRLKEKKNVSALKAMRRRVD